MELSNEKLVELIQGGVFPKEHLEQLYFKNESLINILLTKYGKKGYFDDLKQESYLTLCESVKHFDPSRGFKFSTFFVKMMRQMLRRYGVECCPVYIPEGAYMQVKDSIKVISLDTPIKADEGEGVTVGDTIPDDTAEFESGIIDEIDGALFWRGCRRRLDKAAYYILVQHYKQHKAFTDISAVMKYKYGKVIKIHRKALRRLRRFPEVQEYNCCIYRHTTLNRFKRTHTSEVEAAVMKRVELVGIGINGENIAQILGTKQK